MRKYRYGPTYNSSLFSIEGSKPAIVQVRGSRNDDGPSILPMCTGLKSQSYGEDKITRPSSIEIIFGAFSSSYVNRNGKHASCSKEKRQGTQLHSGGFNGLFGPLTSWVLVGSRTEFTDDAWNCFVPPS
ncbi:unnamed protein product [Dovyalis caffra]|uniref:Uncharacterized protein n=1 Tax=Dovyalis caffra TaxID=77055 RepID=A0AAV1SEF1_9ROSI|nr:unnamed protein product [Dovyalis caffra]